MEQEMVEAGGSEKRRDELVDGMNSMTLEDRKVMMSPEEKKIQYGGEEGQGEDLVDRKRKSPKKKEGKR
eukprot:CAMPEP_0205820276 /NCGR_PEP_ID=MMETSP0206-20130828/2890_1 /ASSEMBLY_ACC=CAM_ASM_000279 /TAXON_ID=36767 /ORGANISM="Euplotes focardii, Strain TN1" /LENGTH=68 /DNA_ID=CAMNT_0053114815 /DNA_START=963 /DNA_END=1169 /DNA_ORIENTATION=-